MKQQLTLLLSAFFFIYFSAQAANDQTLQSSPTQVKIQVVNGCILNNMASGVAAIGTLNFGDIYKLTVARDAATATGNGNIELRCTPGTTAKITMNAGLNGSGISTRKMKLSSGTAMLSYQLYTSAARQIIWDDTVGMSVIFNTDETQSIPIYGRVPVQTTPTSGSYSDQITVTVSY